MGAEGDDNLDNDGAGDLLAEISTALTQRILKLLVHPRAHEYDDEEIAELFVRIEMLFALHDRRMLSIAPEPEELRKLVDPYLARWEAYHRAAGHEPPGKRKASMIGTFQQLLRVSIEVIQERGSFVPVERDPQAMSDMEREHHERMMRVFDAVERRSDDTRNA
ncbi:hypothetical protein [Chthoniobacter flavus]|nr:hypothetical protein [Chthoniobacter flavus]